jgi:hypothetical protein
MSFKKTVSSLLPQGLKDAGKQAYYTAKNTAQMQKLAATPPPALRPGLRLYAYLGGAFGVGMLGGMVAEGCRSAGIPLSIGALRADELHRFDSTKWDDLVEEESDFDTNLLAFNADCAQQLMTRIGADRLYGRRNIGLWSWELPEFPERWRRSFTGMDEIWTISDYCRAAIAKASPVPVYTMPLCITAAPDEKLRRRNFGLPEDTFLYLTMYDVLSVQSRKNPQGALAAFFLAFGGTDEGHALVIKVNHASQAPEEMAQLRAMSAKKGNVFLVEEDLPLSAVHALIGCCDCFVSLHRAEGFGIPIAEAMLLGKPVVVTGWSGNRDFTTEDNACLVKYHLTNVGVHALPPYDAWQQWAEPDVTDAAEKLRRVSEDKAYRQEIAARGQATIRERFSPEACGEMIRRRMEQK